MICGPACSKRNPRSVVAPPAKNRSLIGNNLSSSVLVLGARKGAARPIRAENAKVESRMKGVEGSKVLEPWYVPKNRLNASFPPKIRVAMVFSALKTYLLAVFVELSWQSLVVAIDTE